MTRLCWVFLCFVNLSAEAAKVTTAGSSMADTSWTSEVMQQLAPRVSEMGTNVLNSRVEPLVQGALAALHLGKKAFKFTRINLGQVEPKITNIRVHGAIKDLDRIIVDFDLVYDGNADIQVSILKTSSGVRNVKIAGRSRVVLAPTMNQLPLVGGFQFFFLTKPEIDFDLDGVAKIANFPAIKKKVKEDLLKDLNEQAVYPNRIIIPLSWTANAQMVWQPQISGILGVKLKSVSDLPRRGGARRFIGQDKPDVYGEVSVGAKHWSTDVVKNSQAATWNQWFEYPLEVVDGHLIEVNMFDDDTGSSDEFLGYAAIDVHSAMQQPHFLTNQTRHTLKRGSLPSNQPLERSAFANLQMVPGRKTKYESISGKVEVEIAWMPLVPVPGLSTGKIFPSSTDAVVNVFLYSANNLVKYTDKSAPASGHLPSPQATIRVSNYTKQTEQAKNTQQATFNHGEIFMLQSNWNTQTLIIQVDDSEKGKSFGKIEIPLKDLQGKDKTQELVALNPSEPSVTLTLSANIRFPYTK